MLYYSSLFTLTQSFLNLRNSVASLALSRLRAFWGALLAGIWWRGGHKNILVDGGPRCGNYCLPFNEWMNWHLSRRLDVNLSFTNHLVLMLFLPWCLHAYITGYKVKKIRAACIWTYFLIWRRYQDFNKTADHWQRLYEGLSRNRMIFQCAALNDKLNKHVFWDSSEMVRAVTSFYILCLCEALPAGCDICESPGRLLLAYGPHSYLICH